MTEPRTPEQRLACLTEWLTFWKFVLGSVAVVLITTALSSVLQQRALTIQSTEKQSQIAIEETKQLGSYLDRAMVADLPGQIRLVEYFKFLLREKPSRDLWEKYYDALVEQQNKQNELEAKRTENTKKLRQNLTEKERADVEEDDSRLQPLLEAARARAEPLTTNESPEQLHLFAESDEQLTSLARWPGWFEIIVASDSQRKAALNLKAALEKSGFRTELNPWPVKPQTDGTTQVRYFRSADKRKAESVAEYLRSVFKIKKVDVMAIAGYQSPPTKLEIWLGSEYTPLLDQADATRVFLITPPELGDPQLPQVKAQLQELYRSWKFEDAIHLNPPLGNGIKVVYYNQAKADDPANNETATRLMEYLMKYFGSVGSIHRGELPDGEKRAQFDLHIGTDAAKNFLTKLNPNVPVADVQPSSEATTGTQQRGSFLKGR